MKPLFSIIMAVYNNERFVTAAIESVLEQKIKDVEIIVVDDGSTDNTPKILDRIAKEHSNIRVIHQKNSWIYASFNRGIEEANGEYIYILNSDDKLAPDALQIIKNAVENYDYPDVIWTKVTVCKCDSNQNVYSKIDARPLVNQECYWNGEDNKEAWEKLITSDIMIDQANAYKREVIQNHVFRNDVYGADHLFNLELAKDITSFLIIPDEIYLFHQYDDCINASVGKYYGYEHQMYNDFYIKGLELLEAKNIKTKTNIKFLETRRKNNFSVEINNNLRFGKETIDQKLNNIFSRSIDDVILKLFSDREELDSRILSAIRYKFVEEPVKEESDYYFVYGLLESLLRYEKEDDDYKTIKEAVYNEKNPYHIGESFYKKLYLNN